MWKPTYRAGSLLAVFLAASLRGCDERAATDLAAVAEAFTLTGTVRGTITNCDGVPVSGVTLAFAGPTSVSVMTTGDGRFSVTVPVGTYTVSATVLGFTSTMSVLVTGTGDVDFGVMPIGCDHVRMTGADASGDGVFLLDAHMAAAGPSTCVNDRLYRDATASTSAVMPLSEDAVPAGGCSSEVVFFSRSRAIRYELSPPEWAPGKGDVVERALGSLLPVPIRVWVAATPTGEATTAANAQVDNADLRLRENRTGLTLSATVTGEASGASTIGSSCQHAESTNLHLSSFYQPGRVNVYLVTQAYFPDETTGLFDPVAGVNCGHDRNMIYLSKTADVSTLAHELGHAFGFRCAPSGHPAACSRNHTDMTYTVPIGDAACDTDTDSGAPGCQPATCPPEIPIDAVASAPGCQPFDPSNLMWPEAVGRTRFAIGQAYQMRLEAANQLFVNGLLSGTTKSCRTEFPLASTLCPLTWIDP